MRTNCYAYALDFNGKITYGKFTGDTFSGIQPGWLSNKNLRGAGHLKHYDQVDPEKVVAYAEAGAAAMGTIFRRPDGSPLGENQWYVCLLVKENLII